jgi:hypothetical protein
VVIRERRSATPAVLVDYICRDNACVGPVILLNVGVEQLGPVDLTTAKSIVVAAGTSRPDLAHTMLHLTLSPDPAVATERGVEQTRLDCTYVLIRALHAVGLADRVALISFHCHPHDEDGTEHLHCAVALPQSESGRSVSQHRIRERLRAATAAAVDELALALQPTVNIARQEREDAHPSNSKTPSKAPVALPPVPTPPRRRKRQRSRDIDR